MERQGAASPGLLVLTTGLSKPFRRLDKYSAMLQELERHMEIGHPDRGDTQRSIVVYKDIAVMLEVYLYSYFYNKISISVYLFGDTSAERTRTSSINGSGTRMAGSGINDIG